MALQPRSVPVSWLNPRQIEAFRAIMVSGTVTDAAVLMGVTQPAVSRMLRDLQATLGLTLFERRGAKLVPTNEGLTVYAEVARSFVGLERIAHVAREVKERRAGVLRIAAMPALMNGFLPRFVGRFLKDKPRMDLSLSGVSSHLVLEHTLSGECDLGFVMGPLAHAGLIAHPMPSAPMVAVLPQDHPLVAKDAIHVTDFDGQDFIAMEPGGLSRMQLDRIMELHNVRPVVRAETRLSGIVCGLVTSGLGVSVCDPFTAHEFTARGLVIRPFTPSVDFEFAAVRSAQKRFPAVGKALLDAFVLHGRAFIAEAPWTQPEPAAAG